MAPRLPRRRPHYDAHGRILGYTRTIGHLEADELQADPAWRRAEGEAAMGKQAVFEDAGEVGRITDVIFELASGAIVAYQFTDDAGAQHYLPASALKRETGSALCFPPQARELVAHDLPALGEALQWDVQAEGGEFTHVEEFPDAD